MIMNMQVKVDMILHAYTKVYSVLIYGPIPGLR